jgi:hypothetical protein
VAKGKHLIYSEVRPEMVRMVRMMLKRRAREEVKKRAQNIKPAK